LYTVYSNLERYTGDKNTILDTNRNEKGLHHTGNERKGEDKSKLLLNKWQAVFEKFSDNILRYDFDGTSHNSTH
jgi:hypothetical protein